MKARGRIGVLTQQKVSHCQNHYRRNLILKLLYLELIINMPI